MSLIFRIEHTKKIPRIVVLRELKEGIKQIGSFNEKKSFDHITDQLTNPELYEFQNFVKTLNFAKNYFSVQADELDRFIFKVPAQMKTALYEIWSEAKKYAIDFLPHHEMLLSLLNRAKLVEQQLKLLTDNQFNALSKLNINLCEPFLAPTHSLDQNKKIMAALFDSGLSYDELASKFNEIAESFNKRAKFTANQFEIIEEKLLVEGKETFPKWHYTVAIEVLKDLSINLSKITSLANITRHWLNLNKQKTLDTTIMTFNAEFEEFVDHKVCHDIIKKSFIDDELVKIGNLPQNKSPTASIAIKKWVKQYKAQNMTTEKILSALKQQAPLLANNTYIQNLVETYNV